MWFFCHLSSTRLTPPLFIEVPVPSEENDWSCIRVLCYRLCLFLRFDFGIVRQCGIIIFSFYFSLLSYIYIVFNLMCHLIGLLWKLEKVSIARPTALSSVSSCRGEGIRSLYEEELLHSNVECLTVNHSEWRVWSVLPSLHCKYLSGFIFFL
jgi:hypothetical protein